MDGIIKPVLIGGAVGTLFVLLISAAGIMAGANANEQPVARVLKVAANTLFPTSIGDLLKLGDDEFLVKTDPEVSLTPTASSVVRKIGYGESRTVTISTTASGVYSSDGLNSPNFRYPGIDVLETPSERAAAALLANQNTVVVWGPRDSWVETTTAPANSFVVVAPDGKQTVIESGKGSCIIGPTIAICQ